MRRHPGTARCRSPANFFWFLIYHPNRPRTDEKTSAKEKKKILAPSHNFSCKFSTYSGSSKFILVTKFYQPFANLEKSRESALEPCPKAVDCHEIVMTNLVCG